MEQKGAFNIKAQQKTWVFGPSKEKYALPSTHHQAKGEVSNTRRVSTELSCKGVVMLFATNPKLQATAAAAAIMAAADLGEDQRHRLLLLEARFRGV